MPPDQASIEALVAQYQGLTPPQRRAYNEANTRKDFIEPLFEALGWNVRSKEEVDAEKLVRPGFADYAFLQHGVVRFYLEAKPLDDDIYQEDYARQVITYAYSKGTAWAVLTNFARLVVFDALEQLDGGAPRRVLDLECGDYITSLNLLTLLTPQSLADGSLTAHAERIGVRRRAIPIEKRLYESMRTWREKLFNDMATALGWQTDQQLREGDEAIQRLLDRLIFLRNCEDRGIGEPGLRALRNRLRSRGSNVRVADSLLRLFDHAASTYDSELFQTDALIDAFMRGSGTILDGTLAEVIDGLYSVPKSFAAYDFGLIDADVLGQVYEQYLGHVAQRVRQLAARPTVAGMPAPEIAVEAKRERRKERGIYYTPKWVVDYIVAQTVGRFLDEHANDPEAIANLTILDPACGSGSFLIRAYETLLEHHARQMGGDVGHLDRKMREWVLRHNIFGVDLDPQAVEIARLNLLIRMVREEEELPPLADNIQLGNSLISGSEDELRPYFGDAWQDKRPFDWQRQFPDIMARGGFDIVVGNPPYVGFHGFEEEKPYFRDKYQAARGRFDLYIPFVERAFQLLRGGGFFGFICPTNFMKRAHGEKLRDLLRTQTSLLTIHDFEDVQAFEGPLNYTGILVFCKSKPHSKHFFTYSRRELGGTARHLTQAELGSRTWVFREPESEQVLSRVLSGPVERLGELAEAIAEGIVTGKNRVFLLTRDDVNEHGIEPQIIHRAIRGRQVKRYSLEWDRTYVLYPYQAIGGKTSPIPEATLQAEFPKAYAYLLRRRDSLGGRRYFDRSPKGWYELWCERDLGQQATLKIVTPELADSNKFTIATEDYFYLDTVCGITPKSRCGESIFYLLGLLNSALIQYFYRQTTVPKANGFLIYKTMYLKDIPIRRIAFTDRAESDLHDRLADLARRALILHERLASKGDIQDYEREDIESHVRTTNNQIDDLVFDLYSLSPKERALIAAQLRG